MKLITSSILLCLFVISARAEIDPPNFRWGAYSPGWRGNGHGLTNVNPKPFSVSTNMTFNTGAGVAFAAIDEFAGVTLSDTNGNAKFLFDGFASTLSFLDKTATTRLDIDAANKLHINNPIITGTLTGSILNATNLPVSGLNTNGGTPGQVATAQANGTVTWSNAPAGSGSSVTFNPNQFGSSSIGTNLLDGVLITNPVVKITTDTDHTLIQTTTGGTPFLSYNVSPDTLVFNRPPIADGSLVTNIVATNISSTFSLGQIAGGFGANAFWLGQNAVLIGDGFMGGSVDPRLAGASTLGGSVGTISSLPAGVNMNGAYRMGSYPTNTGSYGVLRMLPSGGAYFSNKLSMDVGFSVAGYELTEHAVGAVNNTTTIAVTDAIRWVANTNWSANWIANCMSNSVASFVTSSVPVTINSTIRLSIDADFTSARFYTNGVIACIISTSIPAGRVVAPIVRTMATANTGASTIQYNYSDYIWVLYY